MKRLLMALAALVIAVSAFAESSSVPGATYVDDARRDRDFQLIKSNIINNYAAKSAPGVRDSSFMISIGSATHLAANFYAIVSDSGTAGARLVRYQEVFVRVRFGRSTANDSTSSLPYRRWSQAGWDNGTSPAGAIDTLKIAPASDLVGATTGASNIIITPLPGEKIIQVAPYTANGRQYCTLDLGPVPDGATHATVILGVGRVVTTVSTVRGTTTNAIDTKWTVAYRIDLLGSAGAR